MLLHNKVAIITGASSGIGAAAARRFAAEGARLVISARRTKLLEAVAADIQAAGGSALCVPGDCRDDTHAVELVRQAVEAFGGLDIALNNIGTLGQPGPLSSMSLSNWREVLDTNLTSAFLAARAQLPELVRRGGGSLIFTSTFVGHSMGMPGMAAYGASKAGLQGLVYCLAAEHGADGVRVNALLPGGTRTDMSGTDPAQQAWVAGLHPLGRMAAPQEIAASALFLASDLSSFVTGSALLADGGNSIFKAASPPPV